VGTTAPDTVKRLVDRFDQDRKVFLSADYEEEQLRVSPGPSPSIRHSSFVIRTFPDESLGWDTDNKRGLSETFKPVIHEESIKVAGATKAPDYTFRIGGRRVFVEVTTPLGCEEQRRDASDTSDLSFQSLLSLLSLPSLLRSASRA
jgi:hypothetical protein